MGRPAQPPGGSTAEGVRQNARQETGYGSETATRRLSFAFHPRDANFVWIEEQRAAGREIVDVWALHRERNPHAWSLKIFYRRYAEWRAASKPEQFEPDAQVRRPSPTRGGLLFLDETGSALQVRRNALAVRSPDGKEQIFQAGDHKLKSIILAASASVTTDAVQWLAGERVGLLIANKSLTAFSLFDCEPTLRTDKNALARRRAQFEVAPISIARHIVERKIETMPPLEHRAVHLERLDRARTVDDVIAVEAVATGAYWRTRRGFEMRFRDDIPPSWGLFCARGDRKPARRGARLQSSNRHAATPLAALLNYAYAVALAQVVRAIVGLGLDPAFGFLHSDKIGRVSFAYDCLELLRVRVDDLVFDFVASRTFRRVEFEVEDRSRVRLGRMLAREVASRILKNVPFDDCEQAVLNVMAIAPRPSLEAPTSLACPKGRVQVRIAAVRNFVEPIPHRAFERNARP
jgi:CRISPR-associated endonuclease Cas1